MTLHYDVGHVLIELPLIQGQGTYVRAPIEPILCEFSSSRKLIDHSAGILFIYGVFIKNDLVIC